MAMQSLPGSALELIETELYFQLLVRQLANPSCLTLLSTAYRESTFLCTFIRSSPESLMPRNSSHLGQAPGEQPNDSSHLAHHLSFDSMSSTDRFS
jgi:hypothetical protein